ncbi:MAG: DHH family phosphoesterase [Oscillospiraceae bacterium]|jgi:phosphoesterase RecJ-like protein|nr:DHH family phosphoesterase [Oscillospiraceae bacterium]
MRQIDENRAAALLSTAPALRILTHSHPDGDTLGCAFALARAARALGKSACVLCEDTIPAQFDYMAADLRLTEHANAFTVCVDVADEHLLGKSLAEQYHGRIDLSVDHHPTNTHFAAETLVRPEAAATAEILCDLIDLLGVPLDLPMASCLYTGISTDTGCFRYTNTTAATHRYAARFIELGTPAAELDRLFFETKTKTCLALERMAFDGLRYFCGERVALIAVTQDMFRQSGSNEDEYIKLVAQTRQIEGVTVGVSIRERTDGSYKISLRSHPPVDAAAICGKMGGGGHTRAAGCASEATLEQTISTIVGHISKALDAHAES